MGAITVRQRGNPKTHRASPVDGSPFHALHCTGDRFELDGYWWKQYEGRTADCPLCEMLDLPTPNSPTRRRSDREVVHKSALSAFRRILEERGYQSVLVETYADSRYVRVTWEA